MAIKCGLSVDSRIGSYTLLQLACKMKKRNMIEYLLEKGASLDERKKGRNIALDMVCKNKDWKSLDILLEFGKNVFANQDIIYIGIILNEYAKKLKDKKKNKRRIKNKKKLKLLFYMQNALEDYKIDYNKEYQITKIPIQRIIYDNIVWDDMDLFKFFTNQFEIDINSFEFDINTFRVNNQYCYITSKNRLIDVALLHDSKKIFLNLLNMYSKNNINVFENSDLLSSAITYKNLDMINIILGKKPEIINLKDSKGQIPLILAASQNNLEIVRLLIDHGASVNLRNAFGETAMWYAHKNENEKMIDFLGGLCEENIVLIDSVKSGDIQFIEQLLERKDIDINAKDKEGKTALMNAIERRLDEKIIKLLLEKDGLDINAKDAEGKTALMHAIERHLDEKIIKLLLKKDGLDINAKDEEGKTTLMYAINEKYNKVLKELLKREDLNLKDKTAVNYFIEHLMFVKECIDLFFERNDIVDKSKLINNIKIRYSYDDDIMNLIQGRVNEFTYQVVENNNEYIQENRENRRDRGNRRNRQNKKNRENEENERHICEDGNNRTNLMEMAEKGNYDEVKRILEMPDINLYVKDNFDDTAIQYAVRGGNLDIVKLFVQKGVDIDIKNGSGNSLLIVLIKKMGKTNDSLKINFFQIARYLIFEKNIDLNAENYFGETALSCAEKSNNIKILSFIEAKNNNVDNDKPIDITRENKQDNRGIII